MNKAEMARQFARQTVEQQHNMDRRVQAEMSEIINGIKAQKEALTKIMDDQQKLGTNLTITFLSLEADAKYSPLCEKAMSLIGPLCSIYVYMLSPVTKSHILIVPSTEAVKKKRLSG